MKQIGLFRIEPVPYVDDTGIAKQFYAKLEENQMIKDTAYENTNLYANNPEYFVYSGGPCEVTHRVIINRNGLSFEFNKTTGMPPVVSVNDPNSVIIDELDQFISHMISVRNKLNHGQSPLTAQVKDWTI